MIRWCGLAAVVASFVAALVSGHGLQPATPVRPNVLLVSIDSLRADHVGAYGYSRDTSPAIDALARDGALFENAISSAPWTVPAHVTMLTGLSPEVRDVVTVGQKLSPDAVTLAEVLQEAGYATAAFVSDPTAAGDDHDRVVEHTERTQPREEPREVVVGEADLAVVERDQVLQVARVHAVADGATARSSSSTATRATRRRSTTRCCACRSSCAIRAASRRRSA